MTLIYLMFNYQELLQWGILQFTIYMAFLALQQQSSEAAKDQRMKRLTVAFEFLADSPLYNMTVTRH